jgi:hypothetical protein
MRGIGRFAGRQERQRDQAGRPGPGLVVDLGPRAIRSLLLDQEPDAVLDRPLDLLAGDVRASRVARARPDQSRGQGRQNHEPP